MVVVTMVMVVMVMPTMVVAVMVMMVIVIMMLGQILRHRQGWWLPLKVFIFPLLTIFDLLPSQKQARR
jgi:hypothetical protein